MTINIGTAGWSIPRDLGTAFPPAGSSLERYSATFGVAEINSSFHRPHRPSTWQRWRDAVPEAFRFSVKMPKSITHGRKLVDCADLIDDFVTQIGPLSDRVAALLVQLPPKLDFDERVAASFFSALADRTDVPIACEPRHASWFTSRAATLLERFEVARVGADPAVCDVAAVPGRWTALSYWRLHGSPIVYRSSYADRIESYAARLQQEADDGREVWCIFDNTASSAGTGDALALMRAMEK